MNHKEAEIDLISGLMKRVVNYTEPQIMESSESLLKHQPFLVSMMMGYSVDLSPKAFEEILLIYMTIWEYFRNKPNIKRVSLTEKKFTEISMRNLNQIKRAGSGRQKRFKNQLIGKDLDRMLSQSLFAKIVETLQVKPGFAELDPSVKGILLVGFKGIIEGLDEIAMSGSE